ncbi:very short patch repair endonuclease [Thiococcus pfennigii]|uniref:very short patch repair endonuclease n=1 Tax=Thiococcus pfennigii TaxID=1057 RepID=UPI0019063CED|nr:very short patch repair endonuclease [Thiococcus pfennigii]
MIDRIPKARRSVNMRAIRNKNTGPELVLRRMLHSLGYRFRVHVKELPGKPDIVFTKRRKVIFVHGCFWHQHEAPDCTDSRTPASNKGYWDSKLARNRERDRQQTDALRARGWDVLVTEVSHFRIARS